MSIIFAISYLPGRALVRILDPSADQLRILLLSPAFGLVLIYGVVGWSLIIIGFHSYFLAILEIALLNIVASGLLWERDVLRVRHLTPWEKMEMAMEGHNEIEISDITIRLEDDLEKEVETRSNLANQRSVWLPLVLVFVGIVSLLPLVLYRIPMGIDWVGFSTLSHALATTGEVNLPPPTVGRWTYPPAFPALSSVIENTLRISPIDATAALGHVSLICLIFGIAGAADRWGASTMTIASLALGAGIFAKTFDSGWPTIASQLGLVIGLVVLVRPSEERRKYHDFAYAFAVISVAVIHPTGAIYLALLMLAHIMTNITNRESSERSKHARLVGTSAILLSIGTIVATMVFAPRLFQEKILSEYGWQGGLPLLIANGPILVILSLVASWKTRFTVEGRLIGIWIGMLWFLTFVHLLSGWILFGALALLDQALYSMAFHGFHIPFAVASGLALSSKSHLTPFVSKEFFNHEQEKREDDDESQLDEKDNIKINAQLPPWTRIMVLCIASGQFLIAISAMMLISIHQNEIHVVSESDWAMMQEVEEIVMDVDGILLSEVAPWGRLPADSRMARTSYHGVGLTEVEEQPAYLAKYWALEGNTRAMRELGITHALTSPSGLLHEQLATSDGWIVIRESHGSRIWELRDIDRPGSGSIISRPSEEACSVDCKMRTHLWNEKFDPRASQDDIMVPWISNGQINWEFEIPEHMRGKDAAITVVSSGTENSKINWNINRENETLTSATTDIELGWDATTRIIDSLKPGTHVVTVEIRSSDGTWIDPRAISGRTDTLFSNNGVWIHWVEVRPLN